MFALHLVSNQSLLNNFVSALGEYILSEWPEQCTVTLSKLFFKTRTRGIICLTITWDICDEC